MPTTAGWSTRETPGLTNPPWMDAIVVRDTDPVLPALPVGYFCPVPSIKVPSADLSFNNISKVFLFFALIPTPRGRHDRACLSPPPQPPPRRRSHRNCYETVRAGKIYDNFIYDLTRFGNHGYCCNWKMGQIVRYNLRIPKKVQRSSANFPNVSQFIRHPIKPLVYHNLSLRERLMHFRRDNISCLTHGRDRRTDPTPSANASLERIRPSADSNPDCRTNRKSIFFFAEIVIINYKLYY